MFKTRSYFCLGFHVPLLYLLQTFCIRQKYFRGAIIGVNGDHNLDIGCWDDAHINITKFIFQSWCILSPTFEFT